MKVAILGRTRWLLDAARAIAGGGGQIVAVATARAEPHYQCGAQEFELLARETGAEYFGVTSLRDAAVQAGLRRSGADVAVSINWPTLVSQDVIGLFPHGVINAHCGDLPRYRGNACPNWAILNGESSIGLCAHLMDPDALDAGDVILRDHLAVDSETYIGDVYAWLDPRIPTRLAEAVDGLATGSLRPVPQPADAALSLRCYPRRPEDGKIEWREGADSIHRLIRASSRPFGGAFAMLEDGRKAIIWKAAISTPLSPYCAIPGQIMFRQGEDPVVACGSGALRLIELSVEGVDDDEAKRIVGRSLRARLL